MSDYTKKRLRIALGVLLLAVCLACVVVGQRTVGWLYLGLMLLGLFGILALLYIYNRSVEKPKKESGQNAEGKQKPEQN